MSECTFCKIINGEIPCLKVYENDKFLAFLDIYPLNPGHTLLIPKKHFDWVDDVSNYAEYWELARTLSQAIQKALNPITVAKIVYGLGVPHAHIHLVPKFQDDDHLGGIHPDKIKKIKEEEMKIIRDKISDSIASLSLGQP